MKKSAVNSKALRPGGISGRRHRRRSGSGGPCHLVMGQLPSNYTEFDLTDNSLYEITDTSRDFLASLDQDVEIVCWRRRTPPTSVS